MKPLWQKLKDVVLRVLAKATSGPGFLANAIKTATLSVAQSLSQMLKMGIADDIRCLKDDGLRRSKAKSDAEEAKSRELMAKAVEAENKANLINRNDRISKAEEMQKLAEAAKTNAEAKAILSKAEAEQTTAKADAFVKLLDAVSKLKQQGGNLAVDPTNLAKLLGLNGLDEWGDEPPKQLPAPASSEAPILSEGTDPPKKPRKPRK